jgi:hypothetical protein
VEEEQQMLMEVAVEVELEVIELHFLEEQKSH